MGILRKSVSLAIAFVTCFMLSRSYGPVLSILAVASGVLCVFIWD
jgi:hypothetical protein